MGRRTPVRFGAIEALVGAPFVMLLLLFMLSFTVSAFDGANSWIYFGVAVVVAAINAAATWTIGLVWHVLVVHISSKPTIDLYALPGALFGWIIMRIAIELSPGGTTDPMLWCAVAAFVGTTSAAIVWLIRRPDRDAPNPPTSTQ